MANVHDKINQRSLAESWAKFLINKWQDEIGKKNIGVTNALIRSFREEIQMDGEDLKAALLRFNFYGRFRDMGVGRGLKSYERGTNKANLIASKRYGANVSYVRRQPKKWYNKIRVSQTYRLGELLATEHGKSLINDIEEEFSQTISIKL